ncbi:MAG TPA: rhamnogalacturonan lyase B N-terminal domain-containing protein [Verrucomicrobiae bacterium]|jgi:rhamnogalacturonan endolyase
MEIKYPTHRPHLRVRITCLVVGLACLALAIPRALGAFGATPSSGGFIVNDGANLVFTVNSSGDMPSCKYKGTELNDQSKASCIASGLGASSVTCTTNGGNVIIIKCVSTALGGTLTHYYIVQSGVDNIYMATYPTAEPSVGELRYIFRGQFNVLPNGPADSNNNGNTGAIESTDVFGHSNGQTTSKYYGSARAKDLTVQGATGSGVGVFTAFGTRESSTGGPFVRDIENQGDGTGSDQEIYNYMNSGHHLNLTINGQAEGFRVNVLHGPYAFVFTTGGTPSVPSMSFIANLGLMGYVSSSGRGTVHGSASGLDSGASGMVGFANSTAQYWTTVSGGSYTCSGMKPGTYTATLYQGELSIGTGSANVSAGGNTTLNLTGSSPTTTSTIWRIGTWDGTPNEFLNGQTIMIRHPSDSRNTKWGPVTYAVGSAINKFPAVQFRGTNSPTTVTFTLTSAQAGAARTLKIGITDAYENGRPSVSINGHALSVPGIPTEPSDRSFTTGTYRGNNTTFSWSIPSSDFVSGANSMTITPASGSSDSGPWLSASFAYDCVELDN